MFSTDLQSRSEASEAASIFLADGGGKSQVLNLSYLQTKIFNWFRKKSNVATFLIWPPTALKFTNFRKIPNYGRVLPTENYNVEIVEQKVIIKNK